MELTREQVKAKLRALAGADNTPWDAPTLTHIDLLAHDQAMRQSRDEYQAKYTKECQDSDELLVQRNEWKAKCEAMEAQVSDLKQMYVGLHTVGYVNDLHTKLAQAAARVAELEQAENDRVNMGMVLGGMASGAIEAERRENAALKQRVAELQDLLRSYKEPSCSAYHQQRITELEGALKALLDAWEIKKEPSAGNALLWMQNMSTALKQAKHALEGKP